MAVSQGDEMKESLLLVGLCSLLALSLTACIQSNPAQTKVNTPYGSMRYHCPPGQAKKGNCHKAGIPNVDVKLR
jgi:hypothetical protein